MKGRGRGMKPLPRSPDGQIARVEPPANHVAPKYSLKNKTCERSELRIISLFRTIHRNRLATIGKAIGTTIGMCGKVTVVLAESSWESDRAIVGK